MASTARTDRSAPARGAAASHQADEAIAPTSAPLAGFSGTRRVPPPVNEPVKSYAPGSPEKQALKARLASMAKERVDIPIVIDGKEIRTGDIAHSVMPHDHRHVLADYHKATPQHVEQAIAASRRAQAEWANWAWEDRAAVFLRAAERRCSANRRRRFRPRSTRRAS
jgi:aldehyde dehydrogenase family protein